MVKEYVPQRGDIVMLNFNPQSGHEQAGFRPALVISPRIYNLRMGLALVCPITTKIKGLGFETPLGNTKKLKGVILSDQLKSIDWNARKASFIEKTSSETLQEVIAKVLPLIITT